jgi:hypothetical protein
VPADRALSRPLVVACPCKTRPMRRPVRARQPGHRRAPASAAGASASPVGSAVPPRRGAAAPPARPVPASCLGTVDAPRSVQDNTAPTVRGRVPNAESAERSSATVSGKCRAAITAAARGLPAHRKVSVAPEPVGARCCTSSISAVDSPSGSLPPLPHWESEGARAHPERELARADVLPMHRTQRVRRCGASVGRAGGV